MQFTWKKTGDRVFNGPDKSQGLLACWNVRTLRTFKAAQKIAKLDDMELHEAQLMYYMLAVRAEDHSLLSLHEFEDLQLDHFRIAPHDVVSLDVDGDCGDCNGSVDADWHTGVNLPPTNPTPDQPIEFIRPIPGPPPGYGPAGTTTTP